MTASTHVGHMTVTSARRQANTERQNSERALDMGITPLSLRPYSSNLRRSIVLNVDDGTHPGQHVAQMGSLNRDVTNVNNTSTTWVGVEFGIIGDRFFLGHNASNPYLAATFRHLWNFLVDTPNTRQVSVTVVVPPGDGEKKRRRVPLRALTPTGVGAWVGQ